MSISIRLILTCFFLSGFASLIYEVVWTRLMVLIFGATTLAVSTVLTAFMGGLALGSLVFGRTINRWGNPLVVYSVLELIIGAYGLFIPWILPYLVPLYKIAWEMFYQDFYLFSLARYVLVGMILLVPTTLMGATLPVVGQFFSPYRDQATRWLGLLYGLNTLGAVIGACSTGFILLPTLGVQRSTLIAALANFLVSIIAAIAWKITGVQESIPADTSQSHIKPPASITSLSLTTRTAVIVLMTFALSGFSAMVFEVAWSRALSLVLGSTLYAFSAMLTTFLVGLALGSLVSAFWVERLKYPLMVLGLFQTFIGLSAFLTLTLITELPYLFVAIYSRWLSSSTGLPFLWFGLSFLVMFIPTFLLGTLFPLVIRLFQGRRRALGRLAGDVYAINTVGAIAGAFVAGFILIPSIGIQLSVMTGVYLNMVLGLVLLFTHYTSQMTNPSSRRWMMTCGILALGLFMALSQPSWNTRVMTSGVFMHLPAQADLLRKEGRKGFLDMLDKGRETLFYKEGITATVTVEKSLDGMMAMRVNGRREAGDPFLRTQVLLGHLPMLFKTGDAAKKILVIGWGSGVTVGSVAQHPVERIVGVELEPAILEASHFFDQANRQALADSRVNAVVNDGRNYLLVTSEKYDVILSQPSLPWITGASNLFTEEFFRLGASRLNKAGIFCQWVSADAIALEDLQSVVKAFRLAFPAVWIFNTVPGDVVLLGSMESLKMDIPRIESALAQESVAKDLQRIGVSRLADLIALYLFGGQEADQFTNAVTPNTDDNATVEISGPLHYYTNTVERNRSLITQKLFRHQAEELAQNGHPLLQQADHDPAEMLLAIANSLATQDGPRALLFVNASLSHRDTAKAHSLKGHLLIGLADYLKQIQSDDRQGYRKVIEQVIQESQKALEIGLEPSEELSVRFDLGGTLFKEGKLELAAVQYQAILAREPNSLEAHSNLGAIYLRQGKLNEALQEYRQVLRIDPQEPQAQFKLGLIFSQMKRYGPAIDAFENALKLSPNDLEAHFNLALAYELSAHSKEALLHYQHFLKLVPQDQEYAVQRNIVAVKILNLVEGNGEVR